MDRNRLYTTVILAYFIIVGGCDDKYAPYDAIRVQTGSYLHQLTGEIYESIRDKGMIDIDQAIRAVLKQSVGLGMDPNTGNYAYLSKNIDAWRGNYGQDQGEYVLAYILSDKENDIYEVINYKRKTYSIYGKYLIVDKDKYVYMREYLWIDYTIVR